MEQVVQVGRMRMNFKDGQIDREVNEISTTRKILLIVITVNNKPEGNKRKEAKNGKGREVYLR